MDDNPQTTPSETPPAAAPISEPAPVMPPMGAAPVTAYPQTGMGGISPDDKSQATLMWILTIFFGFIPPLIFFFIAKDKPFTFKQSARALTWEILVLIAYVICFVATVVTLGIGGLLYPVVWVINLVVCILASIAVNKAEDYEPPVATGLARSWFKVG